MKKRERKKFALGSNGIGVVKNYMPNPAELLAQDQINHAKASYAAMTDPVTMGMDALGGMGMSYGMKMGGDAELMGLMGFGKKMAFGGLVGEEDPKKTGVFSGNERSAWNGYVDFLEKKGYKGSTELDKRDTNLSKTLFEEYTKTNKLPYNYDEFVPQVQNQISAYRNKAIDLFKNKKAEYVNQSTDPTYDKFMEGLSTVDGWAGSKTSSWKFPRNEVKDTSGTVLAPLNEVYKTLNASNSKPKFSMGGIVGPDGVPVEVEGDEIAETPDGQMMQFKGASHEQGGIDTTLPKGTVIFSDRISVDGKTMQERKKKREIRLAKISKSVIGNEADAVSRNTLERTQQSLDLEEQHDLMVQSAFDKANAPVQKFAGGTGSGGVLPVGVAAPMFGLTGYDDYMKKLYGDIPAQQKVLEGVLPYDDFITKLYGGPLTPPAEPWIGDAGNPFLPTTQSISQGGSDYTAPQSASENLANGIDTNSIGKTANSGLGLTFGDMLGIGGSLVGAFGPMANTEAARASDTPNINPYEHFGEDGLASLEKAKGMVGGQEASALQNIMLQTNTAKRAGRSGARGINQVRAMDLATDLTANLSRNNVYDNTSKLMMNLFGQQAGLENQQDQMVGQGEAQRDLADRQDKDAYYTNKGANLVNLATMMQSLGMNLNTNQLNQDELDLTFDVSKYGEGYTNKGGKLRQISRRKR